MRKFLVINMIVLLLSCIQVEGKKAENKTEIKFGFSIELFNKVDLNDALAAIQVWADELVKDYSEIYKIDSRVYHTNSEILEAYKSNEIDLVALLSEDYFKLLKHIPMIPLVSSNHSRSSGMEYVVLSRKEDHINSLEELKNKKIIFSPPNFSSIAEYWLKFKLYDIGVKNDSLYFSHTSHADKQSRAILSVFFKKYDACLVPSYAFETMIELNPQISDELTIIKKSEPLINTIVACRKNLDNKIIEDFLGFVRNLHISTSGQLLTSLFGVIELKPYDEKTFKYTENVFNSCNVKYDK